MDKKEKSQHMKEEAFSIREESRDRLTCHIVVKGKLNASNSGVLEIKLGELIRDGIINIVVSMREVEYISSIGIRVLLTVYKCTKRVGGRLRIKNPSENVRNVIGLTALDELLTT